MVCLQHWDSCSVEVQIPYILQRIYPQNTVLTQQSALALLADGIWGLQRVCLSPLPVEGLLITAETRTCKHELDPVPNFSLKTTEEVISDSRNWTWVICSPRYYWRCLVIFPISISTFSFRKKKKSVWFQEVAGVFCTLKKNCFSLACVGQRQRKYSLFQKKVRGQSVHPLRKDEMGDLRFYWVVFL